MIQYHIIAATEKYKRHPSVLKIKKEIRIENYFDFKHIDDKNIWQRYLKIKMQKKVKQENDMPVKVIKENIEIFSSVLSRM